MKKINDGLTNQQRYYLRNKDKPEYKARKAKAIKKLQDSGWMAEYRENNRARYNSNAARYRARKLDQTPDMNAAEWAEIEGMYMYNSVMPQEWHVDHVDPLSNGGLHHPSNLQILSKHDNHTKGARI